MSTATATKRKVVSVPPFGIEADSPRNCDLLIKSAGNARLRGAVKATKEVFSWEDGEQITKPASANLIDGMPSNIPGMQLHVNPAECEWKIVDPLHGNEPMLERIQRAMDARGDFNTGKKLRGVKPRGEKVDEDLMKTLIREMVQLLEAGEAKLAKGPRPDMEDVDELPGDYLLNPSNVGDYNQPRYEKDVPKWKQTLNRLA